MSLQLLEHIQKTESKHLEYQKDYDLIKDYFRNHEFEGYFPKELMDELRKFHPKEDENENIIETLTPLMYFASCYAFCEPSQFPVGGSCYCKDSGRAYIGFNMEAAGQWIQYTVHGEQCTINNAFIHGEKKVDIMVISYTPCGFCRQFLNQMKNRDEFIIHIITIKKTLKLSDILPYDFRPSDLPPIEFPDTSKFIKSCKGDQIEEEYIDKVIQYAKESRLDNLKCYLAVGLLTKDKKMFCGNYIENCAHNPSFHPMNGAISQLALHGKSIDDVDHVIVVEYLHSEFKMGLSYLNILKGYNYKEGGKVTFVTLE